MIATKLGFYQAFKLSHKQMEHMKGWQTLPHEILSLIVSRLLAGDIIVFRNICKWWSETPTPIISLMLPLSDSFSRTKHPFLLLPGKKLYHPLYRYSHHVQVYEFPRAVFRASHYGWLLAMKYKRSVFFFSPFTAEKIELPSMPFNYFSPNMTFSSPPISPDCLVFGVQKDPSKNNVVNILTVKPEQEEWTCNSFGSKSNFELSSCNPILFRGLYYCLAKDGSLMIYDPKRNKPRWVGPPNPQLHCIFFGGKNYMVESQGNLLLVFTDREGHSVNVAMYTTKMSIWEKMDSLGDTSIFVSPVTSFATKSMVRGTRNKIFFPMFVGDSNNQVFYSLATRRFHCFYGDCSWKKTHEIDWKNFDQTKSRSYANLTWINPYN